MRILIAPNAFKGTISASDAAEILSEIIFQKDSSIELIKLPIADGGDGTCELLSDFWHLEKVASWTLDTFGRPVYATFGIDRARKTMYLDVSSASGIGPLNQDELNPRVASTYGTGRQIQDALGQGVNHVVLGLGGSASIDLGIGILQGLGFSFLNHLGREIPPFSDQILKNLAFIQRSPLKNKLTFTCLCDVRNTFFGKSGAIPVFGPQKGLKSNDFVNFERDAEKVIKMMYQKSKQAFEDQEGFGAAGGIALGINAFYPTEIQFGASYFFEQVGMEEKIKNSDLIITGEGKFDNQSLEGKGCYELLQLAIKNQKSVKLITSGQEAEGVGFEQIIKLPELDFSDPDLEQIARERFIKKVSSELHF